MDHLPIQFSGYPRARPGTRAGGTMMTGQGDHKIVLAVTDPKGPVLALSPNSIGAAVEVPMTITPIPALRASLEISLTTSPSDTLIA